MTSVIQSLMSQKKMLSSNNNESQSNWVDRQTNIEANQIEIYTLCNLLIDWVLCSSSSWHWQEEVQNQLDSFTVPLHSPNGRHLPAVRTVQRDCHWGLKNDGNSHWSCESIMQWGNNPNLYLNQPITKAWCQPTGSHVSYPTDSPIATRLILCSSL